MGSHSSNYEKGEDVVFNAIARSFTTPISKKELLGIVAPMDQSTVYRITLKLQKKGLIKKIRNGQRTSYTASKVPQRDTAIEGFLFGDRFVNIVLGKDRLISFDPPIDDSNFEIKIDHPDHPDHEDYEDFKNYTGYFETKFEFGSLEDKIFEFVNQIGLYFIIVFLSAMDNDKLTKSKSKSQPENSKFTNSLVMPYIRNAIGSQLLQIFWRFWNEVNRWIRNNDSTQSKTERFQQQDEMGLLLEKQTALNVGEIISKMYPRLTRRLVNINGSITKEKIEWYRDKYLQILERESSKCNHPNIKWRKIKSKIDNRGKIIQEGFCSKCRQRIIETKKQKN